MFRQNCDSHSGRVKSSELHWPVAPLDGFGTQMMKRSRGFDYRRHLKAPPIYLFLAVASLGLGATPPLSFEANHGQTDPAVKFLSRGDGYALFLTPDSAVFKLRSSQREFGSRRWCG